ncbi:MAG: beta-galactosidase [Lachnospiraceae bacterium]|nr:beta-galactosidase [Lachnospiraceae bacterium]
MKDFLFGAAYYDEYMPYDRIDDDFKLLKEGGFNVVRIAESTWSSLEPSDGVFDFTHIDRMLDAAQKYGIKVIVGTPTYAIPSWLDKKYPDIIAETKAGKGIYGARQQNDLTNPDYLRYCERIIRKLTEHVAKHPCVIGYQLDNETRSAGAASIRTQKIFINKLKEKYKDIDLFNKEFGLDYWSNRISSWEDFPDIRGTINQSLSAAYKGFLRETVTGFIKWQAMIVNEYKKPEQFITNNLDYSWTTHSFGLQPLTDQADVAEYLDITGTDIYHPSAGDFTGREIAFCSGISRSLKKAPYIVLETQAQGNPGWLPYRGQLRLAAYSHIAGGACGILYWHFHSIHNAIESYWKGILSHDLLPNETYKELTDFKKEFDTISHKALISYKNNRIAILIDTASLVGLEEFPISSDLDYNTILRNLYDTLYDLNLECDFVYKEDDLTEYDLIIVPALYSADDKCLEKIRDFIYRGGHVLMTFKSCFSNNNLKIYPDRQPHGMTDCTGACYDMFTVPNEEIRVKIDGVSYPVTHWMELLKPDRAEVIAYYDHPMRKDYAAITRNRYGEGQITYLGCNLSKDGLKALIIKVLKAAGLSLSENTYPCIVRTGYNKAGRRIHYFFNYSSDTIKAVYEGNTGTEILTGKALHKGDNFNMNPWTVVIIEEA